MPWKDPERLAQAALLAAMQSGIAQGEAIWDNYIAELKLL